MLNRRGANCGGGGSTEVAAAPMKIVEQDRVGDSGAEERSAVRVRSEDGYD